MSFQKLFDFESALAEYTGAPYVVVTDGCTHAIELCMRYDQVKSCKFTAYTYLSIPMKLRQLGIDYELVPEAWTGEYQFYGTRIWDSARRLERNMYRPSTMQCLSFGFGKPLSIGRCGAILLDDSESYSKLSCMRSDGRDLNITPWESQTNFSLGWHYCPTLETCATGLTLLGQIKETVTIQTYPDLRKINIIC